MEDDDDLRRDARDASVDVLVADLGLSDGQGDTLGLEATGEESR